MGGWCPRAPSSHVVAAPPSSAMNARRLRPRVIAVPIALVAIIGAASAARLPKTD